MAECQMLGLEAAVERLRRNDPHLVALGLKERIGCEGAKALAEALCNNSILENLSLWKNNIGAEGAKALAEALRQNTTLHRLNLGGNNIKAEGAKALAEALRHNAALQKLILSGYILSPNDIGDEGAAALAEALRYNTVLLELNLQFSDIGAEGAEALADALRENSSLQNLNLQANHIGPEGAVALAEALRHNTTLLQLNIAENNNIGDKGAKELGGALRRNNALLQLDLSQTGVGPEGTKALAESLRYNVTLLQLNIAENRIGAEEAKMLSDALRHNTVLQQLDLQTNNIDAEGARALSESLRYNVALQKLNLDDNVLSPNALDEVKSALGNPRRQRRSRTPLRTRASGWQKLDLATAVERLQSNAPDLVALGLVSQIGADGAKALAGALLNNSSLQQLQLYGNDIGPEGAEALAKALKCNSALKELNLYYNNIGAEGAKAFAEALRHNSSLQQVNFSCNDIGAEGAKALAEALRFNMALRQLNLHGNKIGADGAKALLEAVRHNVALQKLDLGGNILSTTYLAEVERALADPLRSGHRPRIPIGHPPNGHQATPADLELPRRGVSLTEVARSPEHHHSLQELTKDQLNACKGNAIGRGGFSSVYVGELEGAKVAIKVLGADATLQGLDDYAAEVQTLAAVRHPFVVQIFAKCDEERALVMELMEGGTLQDRLDNDTLPWYDRTRVLYEAAVGLRFLHNQYRPVLHRDIKPSNLLLTSDLRGKLADMGLAKRMSYGATQLTTENVLKGTIHYLCPDYQTKGHYRAACDVFALGVTIAVTVTNDSPAQMSSFLAEGKEDGILGDLVDMRAGTQGWDMSVALELLALAMRCLKTRADRRPSMKEVVDTLSNLRDKAVRAAQVYESKSLDSMQKLLECPITCDVMEDPVQAEDGHTYERVAIETHLHLRQSSPMTNLAMGPRLTPNHAIKSMVDIWKGMGGKLEP